MVIIREHVHYEAVSTRKARLGAVRFRLGPLLPLAYFASPSVRETINRALRTVEVIRQSRADSMAKLRV